MTKELTRVMIEKEWYVNENELDKLIDELDDEGDILTGELKARIKG